MSDFGLPQLPCSAGSLDTLVVLGEFPNRLPELIHLQLLPQVTSHLGQLQLLRSTGLLDTFVLLAVLCSLKFPKLLQGLLQLQFLLAKYFLHLIPGGSKFLDLGFDGSKVLFGFCSTNSCRFVSKIAVFTLLSEVLQFIFESSY